MTKLTFTCPAGDEVVLYRVNAGGHSWPDSAFTKAIASIVGPTTSTINATDLAWQFFQDHPKEN